MSSNKKQLEFVLKLAKEKKTQALKQYVALNNQAQRSEAEYHQLIKYRHEYQNRLNVNTKETMDIKLFRLYTRFILQLDRAILEQQTKEKQLKSLSIEKYKVYLKCKSKTEGLDKMLKKTSDEYQYQIEKEEQKQQDESASNQWYISRKDLD